MNITPVAAPGRDRSKVSVSHQSIRKVAYQIGSAFKSCVCSSIYVFRAHEPEAMGWTIYCWDCSRKDEATGFHTERKVRKPLLVTKPEYRH